MSQHNTRGHGMALIIATLSLVIGGPAVACAAAPVGLDVETVPACTTPDGAHGDSTGAWPCVWDTATHDGGVWGQMATRWTLYVNTGCPVLTVQPAPDVKCIDVRDWYIRTGPVVTVGERYNRPFDAGHGDIVNVAMDPAGDVVTRCFHLGGHLVKTTCLAVDF